MNAADMPDNPAVGPLPLHRNISYSNLSPDTRWWLQLQPSYGYQKGLAYEQLNALEAEMESLRAEIVNSPSKIDEVPPHDDRHSRDFDGNTSTESSFDAHCRIFADRMSKNPEVNNQEVNVLYDKNAQEFTALKDTSDNSKWIGIDPVECVQPQKSNDYCFDPETFWIRGEKNVPWWRTTDKDDLASLLTQKSIDYFGNCDLPPPQMLHFRRSPCGCPGSSDHHDAVPSSLDWKAQSERQRASTGGHLQSGSEKPFSYITSHKDTTEIGPIAEGDLSKVLLLEALRHSQTRAREAEKVAKEAYAEQEHVIKLFLRQASLLFAYKQWFQMLQLETLRYQVKNGNQSMFPVVIPWVPLQSRELQKSWQKFTRGKRGKHDRPTHDISKYAVAVALGLSLIGAGLLMGWTLGWMMPV